jgi:hypothetical protein
VWNEVAFQFGPEVVNRVLWLMRESEEMIRGKTQIWENRVGIKRNTNFFFYEIW